ncbi:MAG: toll/interleukin-1 receptor domain-containing protein [Verrucomicrobiales bacterium]|nr:toll/interleukin-1 receptor domain-containing protein [Verrucomicrobiales bacterium]
MNGAIPEVAVDSTFWDQLSYHVGEACVIPIIGPEVLVWDDNPRVTLDTLVAAELRAWWKLPEADGHPASATHEAVCEHLARGGVPADIYTDLRSATLRILESRPVPETLRRLADIRRFRIFVTTTPDDLMERALREADPTSPPSVLAYQPRKKQDLPKDFFGGSRRVVYHLLGRLSPAPEYAVTDEDVLEFVSALQDPTRRPGDLLDELKCQHLLLLGCRFPDWLARFILRIVKGQRLSVAADGLEFVAGEGMRADKGLGHFLRHFSKHTRVLRTCGPTEVIERLHRQWAGTPAAWEKEPDAGSGTRLVASEPQAGRYVFLSYASDDREAALALFDGLTRLGVEVWMDRTGLAGGEEWDATICRRIRGCGYFVPLVSRHTESRPKAYFRREWNEAAESARSVDPSVPFLLPISLDDIDPQRALVPDIFRKVQWFKGSRTGFAPGLLEAVRAVVSARPPETQP